MVTSKQHSEIVLAQSTLLGSHTERFDDVKKNLCRIEKQQQPLLLPTTSKRGFLKRLTGSGTSTHIEAHSEEMEGLLPLAASVADKTHCIGAEQAYLESLRFRTLEQRYGTVAEAHDKTVEWIFDRASSQESPFVHFLTSEHAVFRITGKQGSGKSTLMRFLCEHDQMHEALSVWAGSARLVTAKYFFWNAGSKEPKSLNGLLRSCGSARISYRV